MMPAMVQRRAAWGGCKVVAAVCLALALAAGCEGDEPLDVSAAGCPNEVPTDGSSCPRAGLVCNYYTGCETFYPASCGDDLRWSFEDECALAGGAGPGGSSAGGSDGGSSAGGSSAGGSAGAGGSSAGGASAGGQGGIGGAGGSG